MRRAVLIAVICAVSLLGLTGAAQAIVVTVGGAGTLGVSLVPGTTTASLPGDVSLPPPAATCTDPALAQWPDLPQLPSTGLCFHDGGSVMHSNQTFALTWDPQRDYWQTTRNYVEQFLRDVADSSGAAASPYAVVTQYTDPGGRAQNSSSYGGGAIDYGDPGGFTADFGDTAGSGAGHNYPGGEGSCYGTGSGPCLTDADIQGEVTAIVSATQLNLYHDRSRTPLIVVLTAPGVGVCLDAARSLCSANTAAAAQFCSYHSQVQVGGVQFAYVVQPWTAHTGCDEPGLPNPTNAAIDAGIRLVGPLSQGEINAITNPWLNAWYANTVDNNGWEMSDNGGCRPMGLQFDAVTLGTSGQNPYYLPPGFSNAGVLESDPNVPACAHGVALAASFVAPSAVPPGDEVWLDGSISVSSLIVPGHNYVWNFGDGSPPVQHGPSVSHVFVKPGTYTVTLTVTDRAGNTSTSSQTIDVFGPAGPAGALGLNVKLALMPESLTAVLHRGLAMTVTSNQPADGFTTVSIPRAAAGRAGIKGGSGPTVQIGRGTLSGLKSGSNLLRLRLSHAVEARLRRLRHVKLTVRLYLVAHGGNRLAADVSGRY